LLKQNPIQFNPNVTCFLSRRYHQKKGYFSLYLQVTWWISYSRSYHFLIIWILKWWLIGH